MTFPTQTPEEISRAQESDVSIIRREFVALTGDLFSAVILNQLLYWTQRVKDFDLLLEEERQLKPDCNISPRHGWIYKTADELNEETMLGISHPTMRKYLKLLIDHGWIDERANPVERWNKTTQYRVNLRKIQEDLSVLGRTLPHVYLKAFASSLQGCHSKGLENSFQKVEEIPNVKNLHSDENPEDPFLEDLPKSEENSSVRNLHSNEKSENPLLEGVPQTEENSNERNLHSDVRNFGSNESSLHSNVRNLHSYTYTENTTENINKDHQQRPHAHENFSDFGKAKNPVSEKSVPDKSVPAEMASLWEQHVVQNLAPANRPGAFHLTEQRKGQLESLFAFHFQNDMRLWERFCLKVKGTPFLMGGGPRGWVADLDWILRDGSVLKVQEGKYGGANNSEEVEVCEWKLEKIQGSPVKDAEKAAIIASIKDPIWKMWCSRLAEGVRLNDFRMAQEPLSVFQLQQIADAYFLECEDGRLVWVGSLDQRVLNKIDDLRLQINWVFRNEYPKASTFRTRLETNPHFRGGIGHE